jgi:tetratricopeptide (TPR) repeat protein
MTKAELVAAISNRKTGIEREVVLNTMEAFMDQVKNSLESRRRRALARLRQLLGEAPCTEDRAHPEEQHHHHHSGARRAFLQACRRVCGQGEKPPQENYLMGLTRKHWMMVVATVLVVTLLAMAPRTPSDAAAANAAEATSARVSEVPNSGSTPTADGPREGMTSKNPKVSAILSELAAGSPPMQTILKLKGLADEEPDNVEAQYHLGLFSWQTGQYDKAMDRFRRTIALDPKGYPDAYAYLGQAYASLDSADKAIATLETYKTLVTDTALINGADRYIIEIKNKHKH